MKTLKKKETVLSVLQEIRDCLKSSLREVQVLMDGIIEPKVGYIIITDDGKLKTSELKKLIEPCWSWCDVNDLDKYFPAPSKLTKRKFKWEQESEYKGMSAVEIEKKGIECMNIREYLIFAKIWHEKEGTHLDETGFTIFPGMRASGSVPNAFWSRGVRRAILNGNDPASRSDGIGARVVIKS